MKVIFHPILMPEGVLDFSHLCHTYFEIYPLFIPLFIPCSFRVHSVFNLAINLPLKVGSLMVNLWSFPTFFLASSLLHSDFIRASCRRTPIQPHTKKEASTPRRHTGFKSNKKYHHTTITNHSLSSVLCTCFRQISHKAVASPSQLPQW